MRIANVFAFIKKASIILAATVLLGLAASAALLATASGRQLLLDVLVRATRSDSFHLELHSLDVGKVWSLERIRVSDADGAWLELHGIRLTPDLYALLRGRVHLTQAEVTQIALNRTPRPNKQPDTTHAPLFLPSLRIDRLTLERITLDAPVLGQFAELRVHGTLTLDPDTARAELAVNRLDRTTDFVTANGILNRHHGRLKLTGRAREEAGGLISHLLALDEGGISVNLDGEGPLDAWPVSVEARLADLVALDANATLNLYNAPDGILEGNVVLGDTGLARFPLPDPNITVSARSVHSDPDHIFVRTHLTATVAAMKANATWRAKEGLADAFFQIQGGDLSSLLPPQIIPGQAELAGRIHLSPEVIKIETNLSGQNWTLWETELERINVNATTSSPLDTLSWTSHASLAVRIPTLPQGLTTLNGNASMSGDASQVMLNTLRLTSQALDVDAQGALSSQSWLNATLDLRDLETGTGSISGRLTSSLAGHLDAVRSGFDGDITLNAQNITGLPAELIYITGKNFWAKSRVSYVPDLLRIQDLEFGPAASFTANAEIQPDTGTFSATFSSALPALQTVALGLPRGANLTGQVSGHAKSFAVDLKAKIPNLTAGELRFGPTNLSTAVRDLPLQPAGRLSLETTLAEIPLDLELSASILGNRVIVDRGSLHLPQTDLNLSGDLSLPSLIFRGQADISSADIAALGQIIALDLNGQLALNATLSERNAAQYLRLEGQAAGVTAANIQAEEIRVNAALYPYSPLRASDFTLFASAVGTAKMLADTIRLNSVARDDTISLDLKLNHAASQSLLNSQASVSVTRDHNEITLDRLSGTLLGQNLQLQTPSTLRLESGRASWTEMKIGLGPARLSCSGAIGPDKAHIQASLRDANPAAFNLIFPGLPHTEINADLLLQGSPQNPEVRLDVQAGNIRSNRSTMISLPGLDATASVRLDSGRLQTETTITGRNDTMTAHFTFACPLQATLSSLQIPPNTPLSGTLSSQAHLVLLPQALRLDDQIMDGRARVDCTLGGTLTSPTISGTAQIRDGRYENFRSGTRLEDMRLDVSAQGTRITATVQATDGDQGRLIGTAASDLRTITCNLGLTDFRLIRLDLLQSTANGKISFGSNSSNTRLTGNLTLDPTQVRLPKSTPADMVRLDIEEINTGAPQHIPAPPSSDLAIGLDLGLHFPARLFVSGRGLDSEWSGQLDIKGTQAQPLVAGQMDLLRGRFDFLDRSFTLTRGNIVLDGSAPPNPYLDITGEAQILDTQVLVYLNGPARNFRLSLSSVPALPQDELLALILFGRSLRQISPFQAVRLAQAAATLTGVGGNLDFFDSIKTTLGLQEIEISKDDDDNTAIGLGGYFGGKYYIRTQSSVSGQDRTKVEIQLTPKISVETEIGGDSRQGGGINWKRDY